jgi:hypothetical protein
MIGDRDICRGTRTKPTPREGEQKISKSSHSTHASVATRDALSVLAGHEMAGTGGVIRLVKQHAVGAYGMIPVMLYDRWFAG